MGPFPMDGHIYRDRHLLEVVVGQLQVDMSQGVKCRGQGAGSCFLQVEPHGDEVWNLILRKSAQLVVQSKLPMDLFA